jgi:hypothetical protein
MDNAGDHAIAAIGAAFEKFDGRSAFLWHYADPVLADYAEGPEDQSPAALAQHYRDESNFAYDFARKFEDARRAMVETVQAAMAGAPPPLTPEPDGRLWRNFGVEIDCFDHDMAALWKGLEIVLAHYETRQPEDPAPPPAAHYREMNLFPFEFIHSLDRRRKVLCRELELLTRARPQPVDADLEEDSSKVLQDPVYELTAKQEAEAAEWRASNKRREGFLEKVFAMAEAEGIKLTHDDFPF